LPVVPTAASSERWWQNLWGIQMGDASSDLRRTGQARGVPGRHIAIIQSLTGRLSSATLYTPRGRFRIFLL